MKRIPATYNIEGTDFTVDVPGLRLFETANPANIITISDMRDIGDGYTFDYSLREKNLPSHFSDDNDIRTIKIPEFVRLDPEGMAEKYAITVEQLHGKTDFDLIVDQQALQRRLAGQLPTIDIEGHIFFVDIRMDMLRPKDDFISGGIVFSEIDCFYEQELTAYVFPYNPSTHEFEEPDYGNLVSVPENLIVVSFAHERMLDPVGYNRKCGFEELSDLKETNIRSHSKATIIDWKETGIVKIIAENIGKQKQDQKFERDESSQKQGRRRGRWI